MLTSPVMADKRQSQPKTTMILLILSGVLLLTFLLLFKDVSDRFRLLFNDIRENAVWSMYQLDREARTLDYVLAEARRDDRVGEETTAQQITMRYDILYSRVEVVKDSKFGTYFNEDKTVADHLKKIEGIVSEIGPFFDALKSGRVPGEAEVEAVDDELAKLSTQTNDLLIYTNAYVGTERATIRNAMFELEKTSTIMLGLLMASVTFLVVTLRRQLKSVSETSRRLEAMTRELSDAYEAADSGNRAKSQFMATMGHEIRTPLNAILGMAELLEYSQLPTDALQSVKTIRSSGEALLEVINEILDYSKIEHGKLELEERAVDISSLAESTISIMRGRADDQSNQLLLDIPLSLDALYVRTDPTRLRQVLLNLLSNAIKFTQNGVVTLRLREFYRGSALMLRFEIEDTGIGIDEAGLAKLFKPFSQVDASISRKYGGTGLGLTICKQIVEKLGGELGMSSTVGVGSIFWFELPVIAAGKDDVRQNSRHRSMDLPRLKILLVEDNRVNQQVASRFLSKLGQDVVVAGDGAEAVQQTESDVFDLILMDMQMPVMDGIEATRHIIERGGASALTPIVAMTANASDDDRRQCRAAGMVGFESKPVTMDRLRDLILSFAPAERTIVAEPAESEAPVEAMPHRTAIADHSTLTLQQHLDELNALDEARHDELVEALGEDIYQELIASFFDDASQLLGDLHRAMGESNAREIDRVLHTIKGAAVNVGLNDIAGFAHALRAQQPTPDAVARLSQQVQSMKLRLVGS
ncbi:ATP-binding protein [Allorhizobium taibaishanense]|uniref:histidine kinase n=1 Tax=Allorhizobium taibaishanense TaxID=887144 RepID=A0A1Q9A8U5_9HYPH|nr:ATP-binding protein [Allorhizobium taibaishanense]MBB4009437.1 signal transduction histidine kinase/DNA-binding NarL/FixJ family response regulator/HPt (histidine-containing phosphotransfer) domain-containing protein [Allorhizobium taibaishanense]OLP51022.1 hybrid sensor histidine kinase/response regulator [Allorhizobium taibaishanense]